MVINMNNKNWILISIILFLLIGGAIFFFTYNNSYNDNRYEANKISTNQNNDNNETNTTEQNLNQQNSEPKEEQIATFTTKIYDQNSARQNNINITCNTLNGTIVKNSDTFSFCDTVGQATSSKGYQEADIFDKNGKKKKGLGGR